MLRVALETSITRFVQTGLGVYAANIAQALSQHIEDIEVIPCAIPAVLDMPTRPAVQKLFAAYWQIVHARFVVPYTVRKHRCDLVHYTMAMTIPDTLPCRAIVTIHDLIPFVHPEWVPPVRGHRMRSNMRAAVQHAQHVITDSAATRADVLRHFAIPEQRATTVLLGANAALPAVAYQAALETVRTAYMLEPGFILCVGSIEPRKNLERVLSAYAQLRHQASSTPPLVIVGNHAWKHERVHRQIVEQQLDKYVHFTGHVPSTHLAALFRCAGVFVYPSLYEGFGLPPLEAMSLGCPVITSNTTSLPEVVGDAACLIDPTSVDELAAAMQRLIEDTDAAEELRRKGTSRVAQFSWERCARDTAAVYRHVVSQ